MTLPWPRNIILWQIKEAGRTRRIKYCLSTPEFTEVCEFILSVGEDSVDFKKLYFAETFFVPFLCG